ncbi:MAG: chromosome segregation protein SMC [Elusimicrobia bacterium]|nr:chromosome segregation protein SMC [Elusimicrobiota bacterium]
MYLKSVEISGFKSFANKVRVQLKPGITCVVGPNGCGKSNVVDSIKWCIGEMSWKSLRMPSMMDVVFAGTTKRQPLNMAEVSMTFDNESRKLPLDFSEVTITRKIYRSDESEYFINKVQCRLKDIREMFMDTGIGTDGYAIIDQGEVEYVLSATAEERRELFEEAAGVSKYKAKREEALRKLEKVDQDMARLSDSMVLIDEQVKKLDSEAKKARLQKKYQEELASAEMAFLVKEDASHKAGLDAAKAKLEPVNKELGEIAAAITALEGEIAALNLTLVNKVEDERALKEAVAAVKFEKNNTEGKIVNNGLLLEEINRQSDSLNISETRNAESLVKDEPRLKELQAALAQGVDGLSAVKAEYDGAFAALSKLDGDALALGEAAENLTKVLSDSYQSEMSISNASSAAASDIGHYKDNLSGLRKDLADLAALKTELEARVNGLKEKMNSATASLAAENAGQAGLEKERDSKAARLAEIEKRLASAREEKAWDQSRLEAILAQGEKDSYWVGINNVLNSGISGLRGTLRHLVSVKKEDKLVLEDALGRFLDSVVCETAGAAQEAIGYLKHLGKGRCRFLILDRVQNIGAASSWDAPNARKLLEKISCDGAYQPLVANLLSDVYAVDGSVMGPFWMTGGVETVASNEPYWEEEGELKENIKALESELSRLEAEKTAVAAGLLGNEAALAACGEKINALNIDYHRAEAEALAAENEVRLKAQNLDFTSAEIGKTEAALKNAEEQLGLLTEKLSAAKTSTEAKKAEAAALEDKKAALNSERDRLNGELGAKKAHLDNYNQNLQGDRDECARLETLIRELGEERSHFSQRRAELSARRASVNEETGVSALRRTELMHDLAEKEIMERQIAGELNELRNSYERLNANLRDNNELKTEGEKTRYQIEIEMNTITTRAEETVRRLKDDWNITPSEAAVKCAGVETDAERVKFLKKRVENMGAVNMTAPEEYDTLTARYNFMNSQVEDLNKAKADLKSAISKINETTRDNFKDTFDKVKTHFKQIYALLFNGGEAELILTMPDNLLETGVEILAHPPGKRLVSISQLSGGEKALTALALLFSFFCVNPSPFCVMDEADAPLDEANVERFVRLIREFSATTQFIVITHNKRTMEAADILYGVTMEELGVSKVISVDLKKASALAEKPEPVTI